MTIRHHFGSGSKLSAVLALFAGIVVSANAHAQTVPYLEAFQKIYAENGGPTGPFTSVADSGGPNSALNPFTGSASFTATTAWATRKP